MLLMSIIMTNPHKNFWGHELKYSFLFWTALEFNYLINFGINDINKNSINHIVNVVNGTIEQLCP